MNRFGNNEAWQLANTAPFERRVELAVITIHGIHSLAFPCRRVLHGWLNAETGEPLKGFNPTHWREWGAGSTTCGLYQKIMGRM